MMTFSESSDFVPDFFNVAHLVIPAFLAEVHGIFLRVK
jgi:hypothetical protein